MRPTADGISWKIEKLVTSANEFSRWSEVCFLRNRSEVFESLRNIKPKSKIYPVKRLNCLNAAVVHSAWIRKSMNFERNAEIRDVWVTLHIKAVSVNGKKQNTDVNGSLLFIRLGLPTSFLTGAANCEVSSMPNLSPHSAWNRNLVRRIFR